MAARMRAYLDSWWDDVRDIANEPQPVIIGSDVENPMMLTACELKETTRTSSCG